MDDDDRRRLRSIEARLEELGVDDLTIAGFIAHWSSSSSEERELLRGLGDRRLLRLVRTLPAAERFFAEHAADDLAEQARAAVEQFSIAGLVAWADGDPARARAVIAAEAQRDRPRSSLPQAFAELLG